MDTKRSTVSASAETIRTTPARWRGGLLAVGAAAVVAVLGWAVARALVGSDLSVAYDGREPMVVGPFAAAVTAVASGLAGWATLAVLARVSPKGRTIWIIVAVVVMAVSCFGPLTAEAAGSTKVALVALHVVVGTTIVALLPRLAGPAAPLGASENRDGSGR